MKKQILFALTILISFFTSLSKAQIYSFEDGLVPAAFTTTNGTLQNATNKYKLGTKSLRWDWTANAFMTVANPTGLSTSSTSGGGITCWVYNTVASNSKITFSFKNSAGVQKCKIDFNLNFVGWRCLYAGFPADMGHDKTSLSTMTIAAPTTGSGTFYIDYLEFQATTDWTRMSDLQVKVSQSIDPINSLYDYVATRNLNIVPLAVNPTTVESAGMDSILKRLENWYLGTNVFATNTQFKARKSATTNWINRAKTAYTALNLQSQADGSILGSGLFPLGFHTTIDGLTISQFDDFGQGSMIPLAYDWRMNGAATSKTALLNVLDWRYDQGWADGSAMGSIKAEFLRYSGYVHSLFLMRNDLDPTRLTREMNTLKWFSNFGNIFPPFVNTGENADQIRAVIQARINYALMQTDPRIKAAALYKLRDYFNNAFSPGVGYADCFKSDFTGYHHSTVYLGAYYPEAIYVACLAYYLFHNTPYALSESVYQQLKNNLLTYRKIASLYDVPSSACGRFPLYPSALGDVYPAFAYLALSTATPDSELLGAFERLWKPTVNPVLAHVSKATCDISFKTTLGEIELCLKAHALGAIAEQSPKSQIYFPYASLLINRSTQYHTSIKGFSKYIWDFEGSPTENAYGRYLSYGLLEYTSLSDNRKNNSYAHSAWEWSKLPGTTVRNLTNASLLCTNTTSVRNFSDQAFLGGTNLNDSTSMFSMKLHDITFDPSFYAYKSTFCFGNALICMGTNVTNNTTTVPTITTLLQQEVLAGESIKLNGTAVTTNQTALVQPTIADNLGNRIIVKEGSVDMTVKGTLYSAVINHGTAPKSQKYTYYMLLKSNDAQEAKYKNVATTPITIVRQDNVAHIVKNTEQNVCAYSIFDAVTTLSDQWINKVNSPCMVMLKQMDASRIQLSLSDPDMRRLSVANLDDMTSSVLYNQGTSFNYQIILNGSYALDGTNAGFTLTRGSNTTTLNITVKEGKSYAVSLTSNMSSMLNLVAKSNYFKCIPTESQNIYRIESKENQHFNLNILSVEGKIIKSIADVQSPYILDLQSASKGICIVSVKNGAGCLNKKIVVH